MMNQNTVGHSSFNVVAVPQTNISQILDTTTDTIAKPVNIKIIIRNKGEMTEGLTSVPKLTTTGPKKVRLVSSDQTIISFDIFMERENEKKVRKKPNHTFFKLFKPSGCFSNKNDDDIYPYIPTSSNETYRAKSICNVNDLQDDKIYDEKIALRKSLPPITSSNISLRTPTFLGKCKPGGCLDPPFGEDKYIYKPRNKIDNDKKDIEKHGFDEKYTEDTENTDEVADKPDIVLHDSSSKSSVEKTYSHSLITYPLPLSSSDILEKNQNKKSKPRNSSENKIRISINEFSDTYFMPPKKQKNTNDEKLSIEFSETRNRNSSYQKTVADSFTQKESIPLPKNELFNQPINDSSQKITEKNFSKYDNATGGISELSSTNAKIQISKSKSSISDIHAAELKLIGLQNPPTDIITFKGTENPNAVTKTDIIIAQEPTTTAKDSRISKNRSKSILDELKLKSDNLVDQILQTSLDQNKSFIENQSIGSSFLVNTDENEIKSAYLMHTDKVTLTNSNTTIIKRSSDIDNLHPISFTESVEQKHSNGKLNQTKESDRPKISVKEEIQDKKIPDMLKKDFRQNMQLQDVISTAVIINEKESDAIDIMSIKKDAVKTEDKDAVTDSISAQPNERDKVSNALSENLKTGSYILSDNIDINNEKSTPRLQEKISSTFQMRQNSNNINNEYKQLSSVTKQNVELTSSLNLSTPLEMPEKTSSYKRYSIKNDLVKYNNKKSSAADRILLPSLLDLSDRTSTPSDNLEVHGPTDIVHDPISNVPVEIKSLQNIEFNDRHDLTVKDNLTEKERSEFEIKNSKVTLLPDYQTSVTPTDYSEVNRQSDILDGLIPVSNVPGEIQSLQNNDIENIYDFPIKDHITEKGKSNEKETLEVKTKLQIDNSKLPLISDYEASATPTRYQEVHRSGDIVHELIPINNVPLEIQSLQNSNIENLHDLSTKDEVTEKEEFDDKETLEIKTEFQINKSEVTLLSDYKMSATPKKFLEVHETGDIAHGLIPVSNASVEIHSLQNIDIKNRHDLPSPDHLIEKEEPDHEGTADTKTGLQINNNYVELPDYKTSNYSVHDAAGSIASINKKVENQYKISKVNIDFNSTALDLYIPKVIPAHLKENLMNDDEIILTKAKESNLLQNENSSIQINLGFHSFVNNKNETLIKTFDTSKDLRVDTQDKNVTIIKSIIRNNDSEIRIPVNSEMDLTLQIKKTFNKVSGLISKKDIDNIKKESTNEETINALNKDVLLQETLHSVYENLVPVENIIQSLKKETDFLTQQQVLFREILSTMKTTSQRTINKNKRCTCNK